MRAPGRSRGFTLVELLVGLFAMSLIAVLSWRGLDGMSRAQSVTQERADRVLSLQVGLAQWGADLDAVLQLPLFTAIEWNGRVLRITRRSGVSAAEGVVVVGWSRRLVNGRGIWMRWQSPPLTTRGAVEDAWLRADAWSQAPSDDDRVREVAVSGLDDWQIYFYRDNAWTNPQSSAATTAGLPTGAPAANRGVGVIPDGVRLELDLPAGEAISGRLTRDWARPTIGGRT